MSLSPSTGDTSAPLFFCMPAMGMPARKYRRLAEALNSKGFLTALFEWRGIDTSTIRASREDNFGYAEILNHDLPAALAKVREHFPNNPIYILGHSLGGQLGMLMLCLHPEEFEGIVGVATGSPFYKGWRFPNNVGLYLSSKLMKWIASAVGHFPGKRIGFAGKEARQVIKDWSKTVSSGEYQVEGSEHDFEAICKTLKKRALMITVDNDILAPKQSAKNLGSKLSASEVAYIHLTGQDFESGRSGHFNWMKEPSPIAERISRWLK